MPSTSRNTFVETPSSVKRIIFERANYKCELCNISPVFNRYVNLEVHHIVPRRILEQLCPDTQNDPQILICVCQECHKSLDNANKSQIKAYVKANTEKIKNKSQISIYDIMEGNNNGLV